jgi:flagellar protein FlaG
MDFKEDSMTDPISPAGSPGQIAQPATPVATATAPATGGQDVVQAVFGHTSAAAVPASSALPAASKLDLSPAATPNTTMLAPKPMNVQEAAQAFQDYLKNLPSDLQFQPDAESGIVVFKVINPITQKVIRQYPPEEMLAVARNLRQALKKESSGILLDHNL